MSLDPASGLPADGVPSIHGADSVHALHHAAAVQASGAHAAAHAAAVHRSTRRHVHVCDDPHCVPAVAGAGSRVVLFAVLVVFLVLFGVVATAIGSALLADGGPFGSDGAGEVSCTADGVTVPCP